MNMSSSLRAQINPYIVTNSPLETTVEKITQILTNFQDFVSAQPNMPDALKQSIVQEAANIAAMPAHQQHLEKMHAKLTMYAELAMRLTADIQQISKLAAAPDSNI